MKRIKIDPDQEKAVVAELNAKLAALNSDDLIKGCQKLIEDEPQKDQKLVAMRWEALGASVGPLVKAIQHGQMIASSRDVSEERLREAKQAIDDAEAPLRDFWFNSQLARRREASSRARRWWRAPNLSSEALVGIEVGAFGGGIAVAVLALADTAGGTLAVLAALAGILAVVLATGGFLFRGAAAATRPLALVLVIVALLLLLVVLIRGSGAAMPGSQTSGQKHALGRRHQDIPTSTRDL